MARRKRLWELQDIDMVEARKTLRLMVRLRDDFQHMRIKIDNRLGRKADGMAQNVPERVRDPEFEPRFVEMADICRDREDHAEEELVKMLKRFPIYTEYLAGVTGLGTIGAGWIISEFDIHKAETVSKMCQYSGFNSGLVMGMKHDGEDENGRPRYVESGVMIRGDRLTPGFRSPFNRRLRTALMGIVAKGFIRAKNHYYREFYIPYKSRLENEENMVMHRINRNTEKLMSWKDVTPGHRELAARRKMMKEFLKDLYNAWRTLEGLPVREPYQEEYLGHVSSRKRKHAS